MDDKLNVERLRALEDAATAGPWRFDQDWHRIPSILAGNFPVAHVEKSGFPGRADHTAKQEADAALIPYLRNAVPAILAMAEDNAHWSEAVATIIARCEAIEDEAYSGLELSPESAHAQGFWKGQKDAAKSIRRHLSDLTRALAKENASA